MESALPPTHTIHISIDFIEMKCGVDYVCVHHHSS